MSIKRAFWPGFTWRILAHRRAEHHKPYSTDSFDIRAGMKPSQGEDTFQLDLGNDWEFDELVIDDWFHLEQMDVRDWWLGVGNGDDYWHVNVSINGEGQAKVSVEKQ